MKKVILLTLAAFIALIFCCNIFIRSGFENKGTPYRFGDIISYQAQEEAISDLKNTDEINVSNDKNIVFTPVNGTKDIGFIFYPGAFVQPEAYAPIMKGLAQKGYKSVIVPMPANFALLGIDNGKNVIEENNDIKKWVIGGHSLGGVSAAKYAVKNEKIKAVVFYASYPQGDELKDTDLKVLSLWGSNDQVAKIDKVKDAEGNLPAGSLFIEIEGGNHAQFGDYGKQSGDGESTITPEEQWNKTVDYTIEFLESIDNLS